MFNLYTIVHAIEKIGQHIPDVNTVVLSDIYKLNEMPDTEYSVFAIVQDQHRQDDNYYYLVFYLYYVDRLLNDKSNQLEIQSHGISLLSTVLNKIEELGIILSPNTQRTYQSFNQRFSDECAGVYSRVELMIPIDCTVPYDILVNPLLADLDAWQAGVYYPQDFGADGFRVVNVHTSGDTSAITAQIQELSGNTSANTQNITILSGLTSANTTDIATLSAMTGDFVKKDPINVEGTQQNPVDFNSLTAETGFYFVFPNNSYAVNGPIESGGWMPDGMLEVVRDHDSTRITQVFTATYGYEYSWPRRWYRVYSWIEGGWGWSRWIEIAKQSSIQELSGLTSANTQAIATLSAQTASGVSSAITAQIEELSAQTSANTADIATLSAMTASGISSAITSQIEELSGLTSANTKDIAIVSGRTGANRLSIGILSGLTSANTENIATLSAQTSSNTTDIATLSAITSGLSTDIQALSAQTSANTDYIRVLSGLTYGYVKKDPINVEGTSAHTVDFNTLIAETGYYYIKANNEYTINGPEYNWEPDGMLEVVRDRDSRRITQVLTAAHIIGENNSWPRKWYRCYTWISGNTFTWSNWVENASSYNAVMKTPQYVTWHTNDPDVDFNDFTITGYYALKYIYGHCVNAPVSSIDDCILKVVAKDYEFVGDGKIVEQEVTFTDYTSPTKYVRTFGHNNQQSGWSSWYQITLTPVN